MSWKEDFPLMYSIGKRCCMEGCKEDASEFTEERLCHHHFNAIIAKAVGDTRSVEEIANSTKVTI